MTSKATAASNEEAALYRDLEHTGDIGIEVNAPTRAGLFRRAALVLASLLVEPSSVASKQTRTFEVVADDDIGLMHDLLTELLQTFAADGFIWREADLDERGRGLHVVIRGEAFDPSRHVSRGEIKAVTYHQMNLKKAGNQWSARIIFDV